MNGTNMQNLLGVDNSFTLTTDEIITSIYKKRKAFLIFLKGNKWNFTLLSIYLNELQNYIMDVDNSCRLQTNNNGEENYFMKFFSTLKDEEKHNVIINIMKSSQQIIVKASKEYVGIEEFQMQKEYFLKPAQPSSYSLIHSSAFYYYLKTSFSRALVSFVRSFKHMQISKLSKDTSNLFDFYGFYFKQEKYESLCLDDLLRNFEEFLHLTLSEKNSTGKKLDKCYMNETKYYILRGTYISPLASKLIRNVSTSGIMLDTTWTILNHYVTSLPTAIVHNVGIPIGFSFSLTEDSDIYNEFFSHFKNLYGYNIPDFISVVESDQGKALKKAVEDQNIQHLCCLRHLLVSLGTSKFSEQIGNLVSCTSNIDYQELKRLYENSWSSISDIDELKILNKLLAKVCLTLLNANRWVEVSM